MFVASDDLLELMLIRRSLIDAGAAYGINRRIMSNSSNLKMPAASLSGFEWLMNRQLFRHLTYQ